MRTRVFRSIVTILSVLMLADAPVHAGPVAIREVIQVIGSYQTPAELRLRSFSHAGTAGSGVNGVSDPKISSDSLLSGVAVSSAKPDGGVAIIEGDVEGTICDCGEIMIPGGGFPKWPLLFLAAIPFFFIPRGAGDFNTPAPIPPTFTTPPTAMTPPTSIIPPPPPPTAVPIPEPASLLLFGSGLAALGTGWRRRRAGGKQAAQVDTSEEG